MRTTKILLIIAAILLLPCGLLMAQDSGMQAYWVHEDQVKPSMIDEYEAVGKKLIENLKKHNITDNAWITAKTDDHRYLFVSKLENMADLDKDIFASLREKMGEEAMGSIFSEMDKYYSDHLNYVIHLDPELSYMPGGITMTPEGQDYRKFYYLHTTPAMSADLAKALKGIKDLYASKGSTINYRVYRSGFGAPGDFFMVAIAAKDAVDYAQNSVTNQATLGEAAKPVFDKAMDYVTKMEMITGQMRPDLAYTPE